MRHLNRSAAISIAQKPLIDWINKVDPHGSGDIELAFAREEPNVYLLPEADEEAELLEGIKANAAFLLRELLFEWYTDESLYPEELTWETLQLFYEIKVYLSVRDVTGKRPKLQR